MPSDAEWLAQCVRSETDLDHEWASVAWVIRNRVESPKFPNSYESVITQPWQFSLYNRWRGLPPAVIYREAQLSYAGHRKDETVELAQAVLNTPRIAAPFGARVLHYYSPISMSPPGSVPDWDWTILRPFTPTGIDPWRFVFADTVPRGHPLAGEPRRYGDGGSSDDSITDT